MSIYAEWLAAKEAEKAAIERRRQIEDSICQSLMLSEAFEGTKSIECDGYKVKITGRMTRTVDADVLQELAAEFGMTDHLGRLFRWKPEINASAWKATDPILTNALLPAITTKPGRPSFNIEKE